MRSRRLALVALLLAGLRPAALPAQDATIYKCTDARGTVTLQNGTPCPPGQQQEVRRIGAVPVAAPPPRRTEPETPPPALPPAAEFVLVSGPASRRAPAPEAARLPPPPALYQCRTWDGATYYGETDAPPPRCAPLQVVGIDGSAALGMGAACEMKADTCTAVPEAQLCAAWYRRVDEAEFRLRHGPANDRAERQAEYDALAAKLRASRCSTEAPAPPARP